MFKPKKTTHFDVTFILLTSHPLKRTLGPQPRYLTYAVQMLEAFLN